MHRRKEWLIAAAIYLAVMFIFIHPLPLVAGNAVDNIGDPLLNVWILAWDLHALTTRPLQLFDGNIFFPNPNTLAYSENLMVTAFLAAPFNLITGNPVLAHNAVVLLSFPITALAAFALAHHLTGSWLGSLAAGFIFAFAHYRIGQLSHLQLLTSWWIPLTMLWLHRFIEKPNLKRGALVGAAIGLGWWTTIYFAFYSVIAAVVFAIWALAAGRVRVNRQTIVGAVMAVGVAGLIVAPGLPHYYEVQAVVGDRELSQQEGATVADYLRPQPFSPLGRLLGWDGVKHEHTLFPGVVVLALAAVGAATRRTRLAGESEPEAKHHWMGLYLSLSVVGLVLSFGPTFLTTPESPPLIEGMPYAWLYRAVPPLAALRVPARLAVLLMLGLAVLAARGVAVVLRRIEPQPRERLRGERREGRKESWGFSSRPLRLGGESLISIGLLAALALEYIAIPVPHVPIESGAAVPPVYQWLAEHDFEGGVFELPTARTPNITDDQLSIRRMARQQYFSVYHWRPIVIGYSGTNAPTFEDVIDYAPAATSPDGLHFLWELGVRRIVVHRDEMTWNEWATFAESASRQPGLELLAEVGESAVYEITPAGNAPARSWREVDLEFDDGLALGALDLPATNQFTAGDAFVVTLRWEAEPSAGRGRGVSLQVLDSAGQKVSQAEFFFPTGDEWPSEGPVLQRSVMSLARDLLPGRYTLNAIVYEQADLAPVGEPAELATLTVRQPDEFLIQHPLSETLGEAAQLLGFDAEETMRPGEAFPVALYWQRLRAIPEDYTIFVHLRRADGSVLAQQDNPPRSGSYPTSRWRDGETVIDRYSLNIPADTPPGEYSIIIGLYQPPNTKPIESLELGTVEVGP